MTDTFRDVVVTRVALEAEGVVSLTLRAADGGELPEWSPGAHLDIKLPSGLLRQYSLCGDPADRSTYRIAVLREDAGRGGSAEIHDTALVGRTVQIRGPRNHFPLETAERYLFVAGGIGITPMLAMARQVAAAGTDFDLVYAGRRRATMAFVDELPSGGSVSVHDASVDGRPDLAALVAAAPADAAIYCCGPKEMLHAMADACAAIGASERLHVEHFEADGTASADAASGAAFEVELRQTGAVLTVGPEDMLLDVVRTVCPDVMTSCEEGFCGTCEVAVLEGEPEHHDTILTEKERAAGKTMMICVGRSKSPRLVLDL